MATKADHVPELQRDNLRSLLRAMSQPARDHRPVSGDAVSYHVAASVLSTRDGWLDHDDRPREAIVWGRRLGDDKELAYRAGSIPMTRPPEGFWSGRYFELPTFTPPAINVSGAFGIHHLGIDAVMAKWLERFPADVINVPTIRAAMQTCRTADEVRAVLRHQALEPLRERAAALRLRAGLQAGSLVAITPSPALDGLVAGWRTLALIREVAVLYGLRPSNSVTFGLLRRAAWTAVGVAGVDIAATSVAEHLFSSAPILKHVASAVPGAGMTARRQYRLAQAVAEACSPLVHQPS